MNRMTKLAALLLCLTMLGTVTLTGCGAKNEAVSKPVSSGKTVLKVGMECAYAPFNWTQTNDANGAVQIAGTNQYANGYDVMMAKKIAESMGAEVEVVKTVWDGLCPSVDSGKIDMVVAGMSITADRLKTVAFSDPYYKANIVALTKKGSKYASAKSVSDLKGAKCTSQKNTIWYNMLQQIPGAQIQPALADVPTMVVTVTSGKCDLVTSDRPTAMAAASSNKDLVMLDFEGEGTFKAADEDVNLGIAISKKNTTLKENVNKALANISDQDRDDMMQQAIKNQPLAQ